MTDHIYIDTRGASKDLSRNIPEGARIAAHLDGRDAIEFSIDPNGCWSVRIGPELGQSGEFRTVAHGRLLSFVQS